MVDNTHINDHPQIARIDNSVQEYLNVEISTCQINQLMEALGVLDGALGVLDAKIEDTRKRLARIEKHLGVEKPVPPVPGRRNIQI